MKHPMTPSEFDAKKREFEADFKAGLEFTSGLRSPEHNAEVGGSPRSKHLLGMAADYKLRGASIQDKDEDLRELMAAAEELGFWWKVYDWPGIHLQGLPPGEVPEWWMEKYG